MQHQMRRWYGVRTLLTLSAFIMACPASCCTTWLFSAYKFSQSSRELLGIPHPPTCGWTAAHRAVLCCVDLLLHSCGPKSETGRQHMTSYSYLWPAKSLRRLVFYRSPICVPIDLIHGWALSATSSSCLPMGDAAVEPRGSTSETLSQQDMLLRTTSQRTSIGECWFARVRRREEARLSRRCRAYLVLAMHAPRRRLEACSVQLGLE